MNVHLYALHETFQPNYCQNRCQKWSPNPIDCCIKDTLIPMFACCFASFSPSKGVKAHTQTATDILIWRISHQLTVGRHKKPTFVNAILCNSHAINMTFEVHNFFFFFIYFRELLIQLCGKFLVCRLRCIARSFNQNQVKNNNTQAYRKHWSTDTKRTRGLAKRLHP